MTPSERVAAISAIHEETGKGFLPDERYAKIGNTLRKKRNQLSQYDIHIFYQMLAQLTPHPKSEIL